MTLTAKTVLPGLSFAALGLFTAATAWSAGTLVKISGPSPFAGCTADDVGGQAGTNYPGTEIEPWIEVNPSNRNNLIAAWQQDRWSNGGSRGLVSAHSEDGGATWATVVPRGVTLCEGGLYDRASDPWVSISPNGTAYFMHLAFRNDRSDFGFGANAMLVSRSTDGGKSWSGPIALIEDTSGQVLNDKNSLTADPADSVFAYAVWDRLTDFTLPAAEKIADGVLSAQKRARRLKADAVAGKAAPRTTFFKGPTYFARTINNGVSWERAKKIYDPGANAQTINNLVTVLPNGKVLDFFTDIDPAGNARIGLVRSSDKGATFSPPSFAQDLNYSATGVRTPDTHDIVRDASILFDVAVDNRNGNLYLAWQDIRFNGIDEVAFSMSTDGGFNWSAPVVIDKTPVVPKLLRRQAFVPSVAVAADGKVVVTYYDFRFDLHAGGELTDHWAITCTANCSDSASWGSEQRLTNTSFDMLNAPDARGLFLGDYMGLAARGRKVMPAFGIADGPQQTSIYTRRID